MYTVNGVKHIVEKYHPEKGELITVVCHSLKKILSRHFNEYEKRIHFQNALELGQNLALLHLDPTTVSVGILHGVLRMNLETPSVIRKEFGHKICSLLQQFTKITRLMDLRLELQQSPALIMRYILSIAKDPRMLFVVLLFRLHYLERHIHERKKHILDSAEATLRIYTMIASALNAWKLKGDLEETAFKLLYPEQSVRYTSFIAQAKERHWHHVERFKSRLSKELKLHHIHAEVSARLKHPYSLFEKVQRKKKEEAYDIFGLRILTDDVLSCYQALGIVHGLFPCLQRKMKDYISVPKHNGYQSLHTVLQAPEGYFIEVQIRTKAMEEESEYGRYAHLSYKSTIRHTESGNSLIDSLLHIAQTAAGTEKKHELSFQHFTASHLGIILYEEKKLLLIQANTTILDIIIAEEGQRAQHLLSVQRDGVPVHPKTVLKGGENITAMFQPQVDTTLLKEEFVSHNKSRELIRQWTRRERKTTLSEQSIYDRLFKMFTSPALKKQLSTTKDRDEKIALVEQELLIRSNLLYQKDSMNHYMLTFEFTSHNLDTLTQVLPALSETKLVLKGISHKTYGKDLILTVHVRFSDPHIVIQECLSLLHLFPTLTIHIPLHE